MQQKSGRVIAAALFLALCFAPASQAQEKTVKDGVFTEEQVSAGKIAYDGDCAACHDMKFYRDIWPSWDNGPLLGFWETIVGNMPSDNPGMLSDNEYTTIIAYILSELGFPAGDATLDPHNGMGDITIVMP